MKQQYHQYRVARANQKYYPQYRDERYHWRFFRHWFFLRYSYPTFKLAARHCKRDARKQQGK